jgi:hypothetical protein
VRWLVGVYLPLKRVPHIWPGFGQMWELTNAGALMPVVSESFRSESSQFPHLAKRRRGYGAPSVRVRFVSSHAGS